MPVGGVRRRPTLLVPAIALPWFRKLRARPNILAGLQEVDRIDARCLNQVTWPSIATHTMTSNCQPI